MLDSEYTSCQTYEKKEKQENVHKIGSTTGGFLLSLYVHELYSPPDQ